MTEQQDAPERAESVEFREWCIVDIMGHQRFAGLCTEQTLAGRAMLRVDVPKTAHQPAFSVLFGGQAIYSITPTTEELARSVAESVKQTPLTAYDLSEQLKDQIAAHRRPALPGIAPGADYEDRDDDDEEPF